MKALFLPANKFSMHNQKKILFFSVSEIPPTVLNLAQEMYLPLTPFVLRDDTNKKKALAEQKPDIVLTDTGSISKIKHLIPRWTKEKKPVLVFGTAIKNKSRQQDLVGQPQISVRNKMIFCPKISTLLNLTKAFCAPFQVTTPGITILTNSGSIGVLASDLCETAGLYLTMPDTALLQQLQMHLSRYVPLYNPIQIPPTTSRETFQKIFSSLIHTQQTDNLLLLLTPAGGEKKLEILPEIIKDSQVPVHTCLISPTEWNKAKNSFFQAGYPCYNSPESAVQSIRVHFDFYSQHDKRKSLKKAT